MKVSFVATPVSEKLFDLIYPPRCPICHDVVPPGQGRVCQACAGRPVRIQEPFCMKCGKALREDSGEFCGDCRKKSHTFDRGRALFRYDDVMSRSLAYFKYHGRREYSRYYAAELARAHGELVQYWAPEVIVPIPLHRSRQRKRGYNQAEETARELGRLLGLPVDAHCLRRQRKTVPQKELDDRQRRENLKKAFKMGNNRIKYKKVLLVDDIYTTGSTLDAAAGVLKENGAEKVYFLCISIGSGV